MPNFCLCEALTWAIGVNTVKIPIFHYCVQQHQTPVTQLTTGTPSKRPTLTFWFGKCEQSQTAGWRRKGATNWKWRHGILVRGMIHAQKGAGRKWRGAIQAQGTVRTVRLGPSCWRCAGEVSTPMWKCLRKTGNSWDTGCKTSLGINRFDWNESPKNLAPNLNYYDA